MHEKVYEDIASTLSKRDLFILLKERYIASCEYLKSYISDEANFTKENISNTIITISKMHSQIVIYMEMLEMLIDSSYKIEDILDEKELQIHLTIKRITKRLVLNGIIR